MSKTAAPAVKRHLTRTQTNRTSLCGRKVTSRTADALTWTPVCTLTVDNTCPACLAAVKN